MYKKLLLSAFFVAALAMPSVSHAEVTEVCSQSYGQPVVCGVKTPEEHIVVEAGIANDPRILGGSFLTISAVLYIFSKRKYSEDSSLINLQ